MPEVFFSILTNLGLTKYTAADAAGPNVNLTEFAVGDSGGAYFDPLPTQVSLVNEVARVAINSIYIHPNNDHYLVVEALIPVATGGFDIREAGLFDAAGDMLAVAKYPLTTKPAQGSGSEKDLYVRLIFERANAAAVTQEIDPTLVYVTQDMLDVHPARRDNPHVVTVTQLGAETPAGAAAQIAAAIAALVDSSPGTLDTLNELAAALGDDPDFATTITNLIATKETPAGAQAKVNVHAATTHLTTVTNNVAVLVGDITHGGTIPLPFGYISAQCSWSVAIGFSETSPVTTSIDCSVDANRLVTCRRWEAPAEPDNPGYAYGNITARYIIIGVK